MAKEEGKARENKQGEGADAGKAKGREGLKVDKIVGME